MLNMCCACAEDQPAPWLAQLPPPASAASQAHARQMPTLLEQLQMYEAQRSRSLRPQQPPPPLPPAAAASGSQQHIARVTSFER